MNSVNIPLRAIQLSCYCTVGKRQHTTMAEQLPNNEECCARQTTLPTVPGNFVSDPYFCEMFDSDLQITV